VLGEPVHGGAIADYVNGLSLAEVSSALPASESDGFEFGLELILAGATRSVE
jgi:hypothetical protein